MAGPHRRRTETLASPLRLTIALMKCVVPREQSVMLPGSVHQRVYLTFTTTMQSISTRTQEALEYIEMHERDVQFARDVFTDFGGTENHRDSFLDAAEYIWRGRGFGVSDHSVLSP